MMDHNNAMVTTTEDTTATWQSYAHTSDPALRERLLLHYAPLVEYVINRTPFSLPTVLERDDLLSCGMLGLIQALDRFDPGRGVKFESFATARIRGAIVDQLRSLGVFTRAAVRATRDIEGALDHQQERLCGAPSERELPEHLAVEIVDLRQRLATVAPVVVSLDATAGTEDGEGASLAETIADRTSPNPVDAAEKQEECRMLLRAVERLSERARLVVILYYRHGLTMKEIARMLGVCEARVSQLHAQAVARLRDQLCRNWTS